MQQNRDPAAENRANAEKAGPRTILMWDDAVRDCGWLKAFANSASCADDLHSRQRRSTLLIAFWRQAKTLSVGAAS
jgi:hypothetical protein